MTDYKPGIWYGWNGGECPVHPRTVVEIATSGTRGGTGEDYAGEFIWNGPDHRGNPIVAFRVVKEYRQPRELWHLLDGNGEVYDTFSEHHKAKSFAAINPGFTLVHYREVLADDAAPLDRVMLQSATAMIPEDML